MPEHWGTIEVVPQRDASTTADGWWNANTLNLAAPVDTGPDGRERRAYLLLMGTYLAVDDLVLATWGLVTATLLLAIVAAAPVVRSVLDRRERKRHLAATLLPDLQLLKARFEERVSGLKPFYLAAESLGRAEREAYVSRANEDLAIMGRLLEASSGLDLKFSNEVHVLPLLRRRGSKAARLPSDTRRCDGRP